MPSSRALNIIGSFDLSQKLLIIIC